MSDNVSYNEQPRMKTYSFACILIIKSKGYIMYVEIIFLQNNVFVVVYNYCNFAFSIRVYINWIVLVSQYILF